MLHQELKSIHRALGAIITTPDNAIIIARARENLMAAADMAEELEGRLYVPLADVPAATATIQHRPTSILDRAELVQGRVLATKCPCNCQDCIIAH